MDGITHRALNLFCLVSRVLFDLCVDGLRKEQLERLQIH